MLPILLKSSICLLGFLLFYKLILETESMHIFKRIYLLLAIITAAIIPFITFTHYIEALPQTIIETPLFQENFELSASEINERINYIPYILWSVYSIITLLFAIRFIKNIFLIIQNIKNNSHQKIQHSTLVLVDKPILPQTFFNYIFLNKTEYFNKQIPETVIQHETTHALQKHSIDVLFIEILLVVFWFNPLLYFLKHAIKLNHEFLADQSVLQKGNDAKQYQHTLLAYSSNAQYNQLANAINYSSIKKRLTIMKTETTRKTKWIKTALIIPVVTLLLYSFSNSEEVQIPSENNTTIQQQKATQKQIAEYNALAKRYNAQPENKRVIILKDVKRLEYLYGLMTKQQKKNAEPFPNCPPPPPSPKVLKGEKSNIPPPSKIITSNTNRKIPSIDGLIGCNECLIELNKEKIKNIQITAGGFNAISFKIKFPGNPTIIVKGNKLNKLALSLLEKANEGDRITVFDINTSVEKSIAHMAFKIK